MWNRTTDKTPTSGEIVQTLSEGGIETELMYDKSGLWFVPDGSMYVYYTPMFWKRMGQ